MLLCVAQKNFNSADLHSACEPKLACWFSHQPAFALCALARPPHPLRSSEGGRGGRDSNPRSARAESGFQDRRNRPLCHLSVTDFGWHGVRDLNPQPTVLETAPL